MKKIAIFASGGGTNAQNIYEYFAKNENVEVSLIVASKADAFVLQRAKKLKIPAITITRSMFYESDDLIKILQVLEIDLIVLAGFLWLVPERLIANFPNKIINVHPALLPKYGGKGMYGQHVHEAVKANQEKESGITIHYVNKAYDEGNIILQATCALDESDSANDIAGKIHKLEFYHFPRIIEKILLS